MISLNIAVDPGRIFERQLTELERSQIPYATAQAVNAIAAQIHYQWREVSAKVFSNPVQLTRTAALYKKGTKSAPSATIFIRDEATKGTPPAKYLQAQVFGGQRRLKGIERRLNATGFLPDGWFMVPGKGAKLDGNGNIPRSQINAIKSQLRINDDPYTDESASSRDKRVKRDRKKNRGDYFGVSVAAARGGLKPGVYQRIRTGFGRGVASIMHFVRKASYRKRYDIFQMAQTTFNRRIPAVFKAELEKAVQSTFNKKFGL